MEQHEKNKIEYDNLKQIADREGREYNMLLGRIEAMQDDLKAKGINNPVQANQRIQELQRRIRSNQEKFDSLMNVFRAKYGNKLQKVD